MKNDILSDDIMAKILIVESDKDDSNKLKKSFNKYGECITVATSLEAVKIFNYSLENREHFDLVMLDMKIEEEESGLIVLKEIKDLENVFKIKPGKNAKIYIITNDKRKETVEKCIKLGCDYYFLKPLTSEMLSLIETQIKKQRVLKT